MQKHLQKLLLIVAMLVVPWVTKGQAFSYSCNFDSDSDTAGWVFVNSGQASQWFIGTATNNSGTKSLYVSDNNGTSNTYNGSSATFCYAYREMTLDAGNYVLTYDWKAYGESSYDYMRVFLAPSTQSLVAGQDPSGGTSSYNWRTAALPSGCIGLHGTTQLNMQTTWQNFYTDLTISTAGTYKLVFAWANDGSVGNNPPAAIDNISMSQPTCPRPLAVRFENVSAHSFDVTWTEAATATEWAVRVTNNGAVVSSSVVYDTTASFTALNSNTYYNVSVASICGVGDTSPWRSITVHTYCAPMDSLPYTMDFETTPTTSTTSPDFVDCWSRISNATDYYYPYVSSSSSYNHTPGGSKGTYWYCTSSSSYYGNVNCIILPDVDTSVYPMNTLQLSFWAKQSSSTNPILQVGVLTDPTNISTFELVTTVSITNSTWQDFIVRFDEYTGNGTFVGIKAVENNYWYAYMDDFALEVAPDCPRVEDMVASGVSSNSATISWSETGTATSWDVEYVANGMPTDSIMSLTVTDSTVTLTGLQSNTTYSVTVTPICDSGLAGANRMVFTTLCMDFDSLPYTYGFEDVTTTSQSANFGTTCWYRVSDATDYPYPYVGGSSYAHTGNRGLYWYNYYYSGGSYGSYQYVVLPRFDSVQYPINTLQLRFWAASSSYSYYPTLQVGVITDLGDPNSFTPVTTVNIGNSTLWHEIDVPLTAYTGAHGHVAVYTPGSSSSWTAYFDDFTLEVAPPCPRVSDLHVVSVDESSISIDWTDPDTTADAWRVIYVPSGQDITSDSAVTDYPTSHPYLMNGLEPGTLYDIYVYVECPSSDYSMERLITVATACTPIDSLPYFYGFEGTSTGSSASIDICWKKGVMNTTTNYPYPNSVHYSGQRSLYFYGYQSSNIKSWAVMPLFNDSIDDLQVSFKMRAYQDYSYYCADLVVGLMTNPYDINTFTPITRCEATSTTVWDSFTVILTGHQSEGRYIAFLAQARNSTRYYDYVYLDDVVVDHAPNCGPVTDLDVVASATSAIASWTPSIRGESQGAMIEYRDASDTTAPWSTDVTTDNFITMTGLNPTTQYVLHVYNSCVDGNSPTYTEIFFNTTGFSCVPDTTVAVHDTIGTGTGTNTYLPSYSFYGNGLSQQIYLSRELGDIGMITGMKLHTSAGVQTRPWDIYLADVPDSSVTSWIVPTDKTLVWSGNVNYVTNGWVEFEFTTPFNHVAGSNLLVMVSDHTGSYVSGNTSYVHNLPNGLQTRYMYRDGAAYNPDNPSIDGSGTAQTVRNNMIFDGYACSNQISSCAAPPAMVTAFNPGGATINWAPGSGETSWELYYKHPSDASWTYEAEVYTTSYTFTTLTPGSEYQAKIVNNCTGEVRFSIVNFFVPCPKISSLPFFEDFNSYGSGTGVHAPTCWTAGSDYSDSYPYIYNYYNHSGSTGGCMYLYNYTYSNPDNRTYFTLPELDSTVARVNETQVVFYAFDNSAPGDLIIGVCQEPGNFLTFVPVDTVVPGDAWSLFEVPLNSYADSGRYITFVSKPRGTNTYTYNYTDDLWLERIPTCQRPDSLQAYGATTNSVTLQWRSRSEATEFVIEYGPLGFTPGTGTAVVANSNPFTLVGLPANYQGEYYVRNICSATDTSDYSRYACTFTLRQIPATLPYVCTFEDNAEGRSWQTSSNCEINWSVGSATVDSGNYAMYISPDGGATYGNANFSSVVNASVYRDIDFGAIDSSYTLTFRAKAGGTVSNTYDGLMVFLVDTTNPVISSSSGITSPWGNVNNLYTITFLRLDTTWNTYSASLDTIHGVHRVAFFWFNQNTGSSYAYMPGPGAVDNIHIDYSPCVRPVDLTVDTSSITSSTVNLSWGGDASANYRVAYRTSGAPASTNAYVNVTGHNATLTGLTPMATYNAWVQKICGTDSSLFSDGVKFTMDVCDGAIDVNPTATGSIGTSYYTPLNNFYNYTACEIIIDSAEINGGYEFNALRFYYDYTSPSTDKNSVNIYVMPTNKSSFASSTEFVTVDSSASLVYSGPLNCEQGWNLFGFDAPYVYDGTGNLLIVIDDNSGDYNGSAYVFRTHSCTDAKSIVYYSDSYNPDVTDPSLSSNYNGTKTTFFYRPDIQLVACRAISNCPQPEITSVVYDYHSATITWDGDTGTYQVNIKESSAANWPATVITVTGNSYIFSGLMPATNYTFRVRRDCTADSLDYSDWTIDGFITDSLPCFVPSNLQATAVTNATATFDWTVIGVETNWDIHVWYGTYDSIYRVNTRPATVGGFTAGLTYNAAIRPLCGVDLLEGEWSDTVQFTTATCPDITGLTTSDVTTNSVTLNWENNPMAQGWNIEYGPSGFTQGQGTQVTSNTNSYVVTGLSDGLTYDFYVKAVCGDDWTSENWVGISATTQESSVICDVPTNVIADVNVNNVNLSWTPGEGNTSFEIEYGDHGFSHGNGHMASTSSNSYALTGLGYNTQYDVYVRGVCEENTYSDWSTVTTFTTGNVGIDEVSGVSCTIYPNPTSSATTISVIGVNGTVRIAVVDMNGRTVATETLECSADCEKTMEVDKLAQGAYFVRITADNTNMVKKLIVR